jgi:hypothetical protein
VAFQTKTFLSIVASEVNRARSTTNKITDYNVGSVARTLLEAPAQEIDELYQQMLAGLLEGIQVSVYNSFNFPPLPPTAASGLIRVTIAVQTTAVLIPANSTFTTTDGSQSYLSTADVSLPAGASFADVPVVATTSGVGGNQPTGGKYTLGSAVIGFISAVNIAAFINGAPAETPSAQKVRFNAYVQTLSRGTTASLLYALTRLVFLTDSDGNVLERVATAAIVEPYLSDPVQPPGLVLAYVHNGVGGTSPALVNQALAVINGYVDAEGNLVPGYKAAGVRVVVAASAEIALDVIGMLTIGPTFDGPSVVAQVTAALYTYIVQIPVGDPYLAAVANDLVMQVPGVWNWMPVTPIAYVGVPLNAKLMPGAFQIVAWLASRTTVLTATTGVLV